MGSLVSKIRPLVVLTVLLVVTPAPSRAELTRVEIATRVDALDGKSFGDVGPYEKLRGTAYFAVDPTNPRNQIITDIDLAPRNSEGKVEFSADLFILKPKDSSHGNGVVFFDVVNRGSFGVAQGRSVPPREGAIQRRKPTLATPRCFFRVTRS